MSKPTALSLLVVNVHSLICVLDCCLANAGIDGTRAKRARQRLVEFGDEITELERLIQSLELKTGKDGQTPELATDKDDIDYTTIFPAEVVHRALSGIQDLGSQIQEDIDEIASTRADGLKVKRPKEKDEKVKIDLTADSLTDWLVLGSTDDIQRLTHTIVSFSELAMQLFSTEFCRRLLVIKSAKA